MQNTKKLKSSMFLLSMSLITIGCGGGTKGGFINSNPTPAPVIPKPVEPKPVEPKPVEPKPVEPKPVEPKPVEPKPVEPKPVEPKPVEKTPIPVPTAKVKVGVIDSGADIQSKYLAGQVSRVIKYSELADRTIVGRDITNEPSGHENSDGYHGTYVTTILAGNGINGAKKGIANGIADVYAAQTTFDSKGFSHVHINFGAMLRLQEDHGVNVFNISSGLPNKFGDLVFQDEVTSYAQKIVDNGGIMVFSAGNDGYAHSSMEAYAPVFNPSLEKGWLVAAGLNEEKTALHEESNACGKAGRWCLAADYVNKDLRLIASNGYDNQYSFHGTSGSAPQISGLVALVWSQNPWMTAEQVRQTVLTTADYMDDGSGVTKPYNDVYGWGYMNVDAALKGVKSFNKIFGENFNANLDGLAVFANDINGDGGLIKDGKGTLVLSGKNTFAGATSVNAGTLRVEGSVKSQTTVNEKAKLTGMGQVGTLTNKGTVSTESGALKVNGNYTQTDTGKYIYSVGNTLNVGGKANLDGSLEVYAKDKNLVTQGEHTLLKANGGVAGEFTNITSSPFLKVGAIDYGDKSVLAKVDFADAKSVGTVSNGISVAAGDLTNQLMAKANEQAIAGESNNLTAYVAGLQSVQNAQDAQAVLNSNSGAMFIETPSVLLRNESILGSHIARRTHAVTKNQQGGVWATTSYSENRLKADGWNTIDSDVFTNTIGVDGAYGASEQNVLGGYISNHIGKSDFNELDGKNEVDLLTLGLYGKWVSDAGLYTAANIHYGKGKNEFERNIFDGTDKHLSTVDADIKSMGAYAEIGHSFGRNYIWSLTPYFAMSYNLLEMDGLTETSEYGLTVDDSKAKELKGHLGFRFDYSLTHDLNIGGFAEYAYALNRSLDDVSIRSNLDESATTSYKSPEFNKKYGIYGVGFDYSTPNQQWNIFGDVAGEADSSKNYQVQLGLKYRF